MLKFALKFIALFPVNRLTSFEIVPGENSSPFNKITLKLKNINGQEDETSINILRNEIPVLLAGNRLYFTL